MYMYVYGAGKSGIIKARTFSGNHAKCRVGTASLAHGAPRVGVAQMVLDQRKYGDDADFSKVEPS